jgi:hypothetical protein
MREGRTSINMGNNRARLNPNPVNQETTTIYAKHPLARRPAFCPV